MDPYGTLILLLNILDNIGAVKGTNPILQGLFKFLLAVLLNYFEVIKT